MALVAVSVVSVLRYLPDVDIRRPLWEFTPAERPAVIRERRRRFGVDDDEGFDGG